MKSVVLLFRQPKWIQGEIPEDRITTEDEEIVAHMKDLAELIELSGGSATILSPETFLTHPLEQREKIRLILIGPCCEESIRVAGSHPQTRVLCPPEASDAVVERGLKPFEGIRFKPPCVPSRS